MVSFEDGLLFQRNYLITQSTTGFFGSFCPDRKKNSILSIPFCVQVCEIPYPFCHQLLFFLYPEKNTLEEFRLAVISISFVNCICCPIDRHKKCISTFLQIRKQTLKCMFVNKSKK